MATVTPPTPAATVVVPPRPVPPDSPTRSSPGRAPLVADAGALGAAIVGTAVFLQRRQLLARRELRRRLRAAASPAVAIREVRAEESPDFADGDLLGTFTHRAHGGEVEPAVALAHHAARFFAEEGLDGATPLLAAQGAHGEAWLLVGAPRAAREQLAALAPKLGSLLGGGGRAAPARATGDIEVRLTGLTAAGLMAPPTGPVGAPLPTLLPLAELPGATPLFANWDALGNLLVASGLGEGADVALTGLVATLASRRHPDTLRLWAIAQAQALPAELFQLPHWGDPRIDPDDRARVAGLLADLRAELDRRREEPPGTPRPDLVLVLAEAADLLRDDALGDTTVELLVTDGPEYGIRLLAATARPEALDDGALRLFASRLALRLADEVQSVRLLGVPDATALPGGGRLLLRLVGRGPRPFAGVPPGSARGYRIAPEALVALAAQLERTYGRVDGPVAAPPACGDDVSTGSNADPAPPTVGRILAANTVSPEGDRADAATILSTDPTPAACPARAEGRPEADVAARFGTASAASDRVPKGEHVAGRSTQGPPGEPHDHGNQGGADAPAPEVGSASAANDVRLAGAPSPPAQPAEATARRAMEETPPGIVSLASTRPVGTATGDATPEARSITDTRQVAIRPQPGASPMPIQAPVPTPEAITADLLALGPGEEPPVATMLDIRCFGHFRAIHAGRVLAPRHHAKAWELLQLLAAYPPRSLTRERLLTALWPDTDAWPSRNAFNTMVGRLRQELTIQVPDLPREVLQKARADECWLNPDLVTVDVHRWLAILKREPKLPLPEALGEYRLARALYRPTLLEGASYEWLALRDDGVTLVEDYPEQWGDYRLRLARRSAREGRHDLAVPLYRGLIDEQPREEALVRELFRCYGQTGDLPGLERQMRTLEAALHEGYGDPSDPSRRVVAAKPEQATTTVFDEARTKLIKARASGAADTGG